MNSRVAISGATGLLGAHLSNSLSMQGHEVFALIKDENSKSVLSQDTNRIYGDMNRKSDMEYFIQKSNPTHFIHLAAQTQAYDSLRYPYQTFYNNMIGTLNILECLREYGMCKSIIVASSDKAYGELVGNSYTEDHPLKGIYPYDASKSATDLIANSYRITYELPIVVTRACNIYGVGDYNSQRLIPGIVYSHKKGTVFTLRNNGDDLREYVHVEDVVSAYQKIMHYVAQGGIAGAFNISSGERYTTKQVFDLISNSIGQEVQHEVLENESREIRKQFMDSSLLTEETGWTPVRKLEEALPEIVKWYLEKM
jgi:CDP-glucose 4,6-dehydratase